MNKASERMVELYESSQSIKDVAKVFQISTGKMYSLLKNAGCKFRTRGHPVGYKMPLEAIEKTRIALKGREKSSEERKRISEARKCKYNGMNGYGHTKKHRKGYVLAYAPQHPHASRNGYVMLHTVIMERKIGRYLRSNEVVHHVNRVRDDNRIENLQLMDKTEHMKIHSKERNKGGMHH